MKEISLREFYDYPENVPIDLIDCVEQEEFSCDKEAIRKIIANHVDIQISLMEEAIVFEEENHMRTLQSYNYDHYCDDSDMGEQKVRLGKVFRKLFLLQEQSREKALGYRTTGARSEVMEVFRELYHEGKLNEAVLHFMVLGEPKFLAKRETAWLLEEPENGGTAITSAMSLFFEKLDRDIRIWGSSCFLSNTVPLSEMEGDSYVQELAKRYKVRVCKSKGDNFFSVKVY